MNSNDIDKLNFIQVFYLLGRLSGMVTEDSEIGKAIRELEYELNKALGYDPYYVDTSPQSDEEARAEHVKGDVLDDKIRNA